MNRAAIVLAESLLRQIQHSPVLLCSGVLALILLLALVRVVFFTGHPQRHHRHRERRAESNEADREAKPGGTVGQAERRRRRRARLNPTLAETRGLPPVRSESSKPPST
jgi:hypothetical protein